MESRPAPLRSRRVCRFCLTESEPLNFIYERDHHSRPFNVPLTLQIMSCVAIEVYSADGMPQMICNNCRWNLDRSYKFKQQCKKADEALRAYPMTGTLPRPFPPINAGDNKAEFIGSSGKRSGGVEREQPVKKPRVDNGDQQQQQSAPPAPVIVSRPRGRPPRHAATPTAPAVAPATPKVERSDSNYRVSRSISEGESDFIDEKNDDDYDDDDDDDRNESGEIRVHACNQCERTFPLRQSLQVHIDNAHRERNFKCTLCSRMFFTKYDLQKHMIIHSAEKPYMCTICSKSFNRPNLLQRHEKIHRQDMRYSCQHCDREFLTNEELEKHQDNSHKTTKPFQCNICSKRFTYKQGLERHEILHNDDNTFTCEYCKEAFRTSTKLSRHLQTHAGHRPYLCKLCSKTFLLSHHLTRHMRTHDDERPFICDKCGKTFRRKESLELHDMAHSKNSGLALTCELCNETCRNRADYVTHIKQHVDAGEKKRPDNDDGQSRRRRNKGKIDTESDDEDDEEEPYSDGDDDYEPPAYVAKKLPKTPKREVLSKYDNDSGAVETDEKVGEKQIIFVRNKEGKIVRKAIKTMLPIQQQQQQQQSSSSSPPPSSHEAAETRPSTRTSAGTQRSNLKVVHNQNKTINDESSTNDVTEAEVQKIVASVFKEHKIPLKQAKISQEQVKETTVSTPKAQTIQTIKKEKIEASPETSSVMPAATSTQKSVNTVKVIKRVVVRKPTGGAETTTTTTTTTKDGEPIKTTTTTTSSSSSAAATATSTTGTKVKRTIIRRIIRQGDTTREVLLNADGTPIDPAELAKLPIGNVVKRVVLKKSNNQTSQVQQSSSTTTTSTEKQQKPQQLVQKKITAAPIDTPKFELKTSQNKTSTNEKKPITTTNVAVKKPVVVSNLQLPSSSSSSTTTTTAPVTKNNNATSERVLQLEKQLETQRLVIQKLQAKKQQEYETNDDMLPDRHDSEDEQELPLKRVFVKRKQSIYDEEKAYNDHDPEYEPREQVQPLTAIAIAAAAAAEDDDATDNGDGATDADATADATADANTTTTTDDKTVKQDASSVEYNKTDVFIKMEASSGVDDISRELNSILESTDNVVKMQENVLNNLTEISGINDNDKDEQEQVVKMQIDDDKTNEIEKQPDVENKEIDNATVEQGVVDEQQQQNLNTTQDLFDNSDGSICQQKNEQSMNDSVIALSQTNDTINLNDTTDTQDSLEDTLSQMEG